MNDLRERRIEPSDIPEDFQLRLGALLSGSRHARLMGLEGEEIELPDSLCHLLTDLLQIIKGHQAVYLMPAEEAFTTQAAANFLGVSRPYLVRLLEEGRMPYHRVGTHRRVYFKDLVEFEAKRSDDRTNILDKMTKDLVDAGLFDRVVKRDEEGNEIY